MQKQGNLIVVSAPSGAGKHAILSRVIARDEKVVYAVSATTRQPRQGEIDGKDYHFLSEDEFAEGIRANRFVEWAEVHGRRYGTLRAELDAQRATGKDVVIQIDVQGMRGIKAAGLAPVTVFIVPPSLDELERRLRLRGTDSEKDIATRLRNAESEMAAQHEYDYVIVNDKLDDAVDEMVRIIREVRREPSPKRGS